MPISLKVKGLSRYSLKIIRNMALTQISGKSTSCLLNSSLRKLSRR